MEQDSRHLIEVKESVPKGLGVFVTADIPWGTRVIAEPALLKINHEYADAKDIVRAFERLPSSQQSSYLELHGFACDSFKRAAEHEMEQTNAFSGVFLLGSRINHSCIPNIHFAYNPILERETFHAIRDIKAGEELTIMYINVVNRTRSQRQADLDKWGFLCTCPACENTTQGRKREDKRAQLLALDQELAMSLRFGTAKSWRNALFLAQKMAAIQKSEDLLTRALGMSYHDAARLCMRLGDARMALLWAEKELEVDRYCVGEDHPDYEKELEIVERLRVAAESSEPVDESVTQWFSL